MGFIVLMLLIAVAVNRSNRKWFTVWFITGWMIGGLIVGGLIGFVSQHTPEAAGSIGGLSMLVIGYLATITTFFNKRPPTYPSLPKDSQFLPG